MDLAVLHLEHAHDVDRHGSTVVVEDVSALGRHGAVAGLGDMAHLDLDGAGGSQDGGDDLADRVLADGFGRAAVQPARVGRHQIEDAVKRLGFPGFEETANDVGVVHLVTFRKHRLRLWLDEDDSVAVQRLDGIGMLVATECAAAIHSASAPSTAKIGT